MLSHNRCAARIALVCPIAFFPEQIMAAFIRCFASLLYSYRRHLGPASATARKDGLLYSFKMDDFLRGAPADQTDFLTTLSDTQGEFAPSPRGFPREMAAKKRID